MLKIYLARHGQDQDNSNGILNGQRNTPLTEIGLKQASDLAQKINELDLDIKKIYSSPLKRAHKTAQIIGSELNVEEPEIIDNLKERTFGVHDGMLQKDIPNIPGAELIITEKINYILNPTGGETFPQVLQRAKEVLEMVTSQHNDESILIVAHGDIGKMIYAAYYDLDWKEVLELFHFGNSDLIILSPDSKPEDVHVFQAKQFNN